MVVHHGIFVWCTVGFVRQISNSTIPWRCFIFVSLATTSGPMALSSSVCPGLKWNMSDWDDNVKDAKDNMAWVWNTNIWKYVLVCLTLTLLNKLFAAQNYHIYGEYIEYNASTRWVHMDKCINSSFWHRPWHNESINDDKTDDLHPSIPCVTCSIYVLLMSSRSFILYLMLQDSCDGAFNCWIW